MNYNPKIVLAFFKECGLPDSVLEHKFHPERKWRFDFAWLGQKVALEVQGGIFIHGGHTRGASLRKEHEKLNNAAALGWKILFIEPKFLCTEATMDLIRETLSGGCWNRDHDKIT